MLVIIFWEIQFHHFTGSRNVKPDALSRQFASTEVMDPETILPLLWRKEWSDLSWSASYGECIEQTVTETVALISNI